MGRGSRYAQGNRSSGLAPENPLEVLEARLQFVGDHAQRGDARIQPLLALEGDCVEPGGRYRNQLGMDVVLEALRLWRERGRRKLDALLEYARMRHVERAMRPYLEATQ